MMVPFLAKPGQGKTLTMVALGLDDYMRGLDIMSNLDLDFPKARGAGKVRKLDMRLLSDPKVELSNLSLLADELWLWFDSRRASSTGNLSMSRLFLQSRKRDMNVYGTAQGFSQFDVRFRDNVDILALCQKRDVNGGRMLDPQWTSPDGQIWVWFYGLDANTPVNKTPLKLNMGPVFPLFKSKQMFEVVSSAP